MPTDNYQFNFCISSYAFESVYHMTKYILINKGNELNTLLLLSVTDIINYSTYFVHYTQIKDQYIKLYTAGSVLGSLSYNIDVLPISNIFNKFNLSLI